MCVDGIRSSLNHMCAVYTQRGYMQKCDFWPRHRKCLKWNILRNWWNLCRMLIILPCALEIRILYVYLGKIYLYMLMCRPQPIQPSAAVVAVRYWNSSTLTHTHACKETTRSSEFIAHKTTSGGGRTVNNCEMVWWHESNQLYSQINSIHIIT